MNSLNFETMSIRVDEIRHIVEMIAHFFLLHTVRIKLQSIILSIFVVTCPYIYQRTKEKNTILILLLLHYSIMVLLKLTHMHFYHMHMRVYYL